MSNPNEFTTTTTTLIIPLMPSNRKKRRMIRGYGGKKTMDHNMNHPMFCDKDIDEAVQAAAKFTNKLLGKKVIKEDNIKKVSDNIKAEQQMSAKKAVKKAAEVISDVANTLKQEDWDKIIRGEDEIDALQKGFANKGVSASCLEEAAKIINGNRQKDYGTPEDSFQRIADYWNAYLCHNAITDVEHSLYAKDVAMMMVLFKIAREEHSHKHDNLVDICGYTAILDNMYKD